MDQDRREQMKEVIGKLLAIAMHPGAESDPHLRNEAQAAKQKAEYLMGKYNLEKAEILRRQQAEGTMDDNIIRQDFYSHYAWRMRWELSLAACIAELYDVELCGTYFTGRSSETYQISLVGQGEDVANVVYFYEFLQFKIAQGTRLYDTQTAKYDFARGAVHSLRTRLRDLIWAQRHNGDPDAKAILVLNKDAVVKAYKGHFPNARRGSSPRIKDLSAFQSGSTYGKKMPLQHTQDLPGGSKQIPN